MIDTSIYTSDYIQNLTDEIRADRNLVLLPSNKI